MALDSTMTFEIKGPGGSSSAPEKPLDGTQRDVWGKPNENSGGGERGRNRVPSVSKPESSDKISSVFYDSTPANPGSLDSTLDDIFQLGGD